MRARMFLVIPSAGEITTRAGWCCAAILAVVALTPLGANAAVIHGGLDFFTTERAGIDPEPFFPGLGFIELESFPAPGPPDPTALFPLPPFEAVPQAVFQVTWFDEHGNRVTSESRHKVKQVTSIRPGVTPFDTIVERKADANVGGVGDEEEVPIEILWLSLKSIDPIDVGLGFLVDLYVGLDQTMSQIEGKMKLISESPGGNKGKVDIGKKGETPDDPDDPDFLGLPVFFEINLIPAGQDPVRENVVARQGGLLNVFHGNTQSPSGTYVLAPEPASLLIWTLLTTACLATARRRRR